jgi:APA family basic amino acid/polyamine antiporter
MGIFTLSGQAAARYAGPSVIISFVITGIVALLATLSFSEMAAMMASSGSVYTYTYAGQLFILILFHSNEFFCFIYFSFRRYAQSKVSILNIILIFLIEYAAWFIGWNITLFHQLGALTVIVGWSEYVVHFISHASGKNVTSWAVQSPLIWDEGAEKFVVTGQAINIPAIMLTVAITVLLVIGIRATAIVTLVLVVIKLIILLIFIIACSSSVDPNNYSPFFPPNQGIYDCLIDNLEE